MKTLLIFLILWLPFSLHAGFDENISTYKNDHVERLKIVREAKLLLQEQKMLENKLKSWKIHKQKLIDRFERNNRRVEEMRLGKDDRYGEKLAQKRRMTFYTSLDRKEQRIKSRIAHISRKLSKLKKEFYFRYAVELTEDEIFYGRAPSVKDKAMKINLLNEYIQYVESYENLRRRNEKFDQSEALMKSISKINDKEQSYEQNLTKKAEENRIKMYQYKMMAERLQEEFANRFDLEITDIRVAKQFLENQKRAVK
jgi:hypothetical protein